MGEGRKLACSVDFIKEPQMPGSLQIFTDSEADLDFGTAAYRVSLSLFLHAFKPQSPPRALSSYAC